MAKEEEAAAGKKSGGNGMMIILLVLIVVLLLAVGGLGYFLYAKGVFSDKPQQPTTQTEQTQTTKKGKIGKTFDASIDSLVLNITDAKGRPKLMKLSFTLKTTEPTIEAVIKDNKAEIIDSVIKQVSARSSEELLTVGGKAMLKEDMISEINKILNDSIPQGNEKRKRNCVIDLYFTSFVMR